MKLTTVILSVLLGIGLNMQAIASAGGAVGALSAEKCAKLKEASKKNIKRSNMRLKRLQALLKNRLALVIKFLILTLWPRNLYLG